MNFYQYKAKCINVVDGDTIDVEIDVGFKLKTIQRLRLLGVDTPERGDEGFKEASNFASYHLLDVEIGVITHKTDSFGRYLAEVFIPLEEGFSKVISFNELLLTQGHAVPYLK